MSANTIIYTIYKAHCISNDKGYIGIDSKWPSRKSNHRTFAFTRKNKTIFHNALRKYGWNSFQWDILYQSPDRDHTLKIMEEYFIRQENTHYLEGHGYNMTYGGQGTYGRIISKTTRKKMSLSNKGKHKISDITRQKLIQSHLGQTAWNKGLSGYKMRNGTILWQTW